MLRGRPTCGLCRRRLQGQWVHGQASYRCRYPSEYATSAGLAHPVNVYLREADLLPKLDAWLARLVSPANIEATCRRLAAASQSTGQADPDLRSAQQILADCQRKLARHRAALEAGGDPAVTSQWIAETIQQQRHAQDTLDSSAPPASTAGSRSILPWCGPCWKNSAIWLAAGSGRPRAARYVPYRDGHQRPVPAGRADRVDPGSRLTK